MSAGTAATASKQPPSAVGTQLTTAGGLKSPQAAGSTTTYQHRVSSAMPVSAGRKAHHTSAQAANHGPHPAAAGASKPMGPSKPAARAHLSPDAAATRIQTAWRSARLARHKPGLKQLATAATQLKQLTDQLHAVQRQQPGVPLTQKQYLELSEPVMKVCTLHYIM